MHLHHHPCLRQPCAIHRLRLWALQLQCRRYRRLRGIMIYGGTMQIHRNMIAARELGRPNDQRRR